MLDWQRHRKLRILIKTICIVLIVSFISYDLSWAGATEVFKPKNWPASQSAQILASIQIPQELGSVKESYISKYHPDKLVIYIQDAHANREAQGNEANLIKYLKDKYKINQVCVEGGFGEFNAGFFRQFPKDKPVREKIAGYFLSKAFISGPDYLLITEDKPPVISGAEDKALYTAHLNIFRENQPIAERFNQSLDKLQGVLGTLKIKYYSQDLKDLDAKVNAFQENKLALTEYLVYLNKVAATYQFDLSDYPSVSNFLKLQEFEQKINFSKAETERKNLIEQLTKVLLRKDLEEFVKKSLDFKTNKVNPAQYYAYLEESAQKTDIPTQDFPNLFTYIKYIALSESLDSQKLFIEIGQFAKDLKAKLTASQAQKDLDSLTYILYILKGLADISLSPEEYEYFKNNRQEFSQQRIAQLLSPYTPANPLPTDADIASLENFYRFSHERDKAMVTNSLNRLNQETKAVILVAGGFHSPGITSILKAEDVSYLVIMPNIKTNQDTESVYFSLLKDKKLPLEEVLNEPDTLQLVNSISDTETRQRLILYWVARASRYYPLKELKAQLNKLKLFEEDRRVANLALKEIQAPASHGIKPVSPRINYKPFLIGVSTLAFTLFFPARAWAQGNTGTISNFWASLSNFLFQPIVVLITMAISAGYIMYRLIRAIFTKTKEPDRGTVRVMPERITNIQSQPQAPNNLASGLPQSIKNRIQELNDSIARNSKDTLERTFRPTGPAEMPLPIPITMLNQNLSDKDKVLRILENMQRMMDGTDEKVLRDFERAIDNARDKVTEEALEQFDLLSDDTLYQLLTQGYLQELQRESQRIIENQIQHMLRFHTPSQQEQNLYVSPDINERYSRLPRYLKWLLSNNPQLESDSSVREWLNTIQRRMAQIPAFPEMITEYSKSALNKSLYLNPELAMRIVMYLSKGTAHGKVITEEQIKRQIESELAKDLPDDTVAKVQELPASKVIKALPAPKTPNIDTPDPAEPKAFNKDNAEFIAKLNAQEGLVKKTEADLKELTESLREAEKQKDGVIIEALKPATEGLELKLEKAKKDLRKLKQKKSGDISDSTLYSLDPFAALIMAFFVLPFYIATWTILSLNEYKSAKALGILTTLGIIIPGYYLYLIEQGNLEKITASTPSANPLLGVLLGIGFFSASIGVIVSVFSNLILELRNPKSLGYWQTMKEIVPAKNEWIRELYSDFDEDVGFGLAVAGWIVGGILLYSGYHYHWFSLGQSSVTDTVKWSAWLMEIVLAPLIALGIPYLVGKAIDFLRTLWRFLKYPVDYVRISMVNRMKPEEISDKLIRKAAPLYGRMPKEHLEKIFNSWVEASQEEKISRLSKFGKWDSEKIRLWKEIGEYKQAKQATAKKITSNPREQESLIEVIDKHKERLRQKGASNALVLLTSILPQIIQHSDNGKEFLHWLDLMAELPSNVLRQSPHQAVAIFNGLKEMEIARKDYRRLKEEIFAKFDSPGQKQLAEPWDTLEKKFDWSKVTSINLLKNTVYEINNFIQTQEEFIFWIKTLSEVNPEIMEVFCRDIKVTLEYYRKERQTRDWQNLALTLSRYQDTFRETVAITSNLLSVLTEATLDIDGRIKKARQYLMEQKILKLGIPAQLCGMVDAVGFEELIRIASEGTIRNAIQSNLVIKQALAKMGKDGLYTYFETQKPSYYQNFLAEAKGLREGFNKPGEKFRVAYDNRLARRSKVKEDQEQIVPIADAQEALKDLLRYLRLEWPNLYSNFIEPKKELLKDRPLEEFVTRDTVLVIAKQLLGKLQNWRVSEQEKVFFIARIMEIFAEAGTQSLRTAISLSGNEFSRIKLTSEYWDYLLRLVHENKWLNQQSKIYKPLITLLRQRIINLNNKIGEAQEGVLHFFLSGKTPLDFFKGIVSSDCTKSPDGLEFQSTQGTIIDPGFFLFKVVEKSKWVGNIYALVFKDKSGKYYLFVDVFQINLSHPLVAKGSDWNNLRQEFAKNFLKEFRFYLAQQGFDYLLISQSPSSQKIGSNLIKAAEAEGVKKEPLSLKKLGGTGYFREFGLSREFVQNLGGDVRQDFQSVTGYRIALEKINPLAVQQKREEIRYLESLINQMKAEVLSLERNLREKKQEFNRLSEAVKEAASLNKPATAEALKTAYQEKEIEIKKIKYEVLEIKKKIKEKEYELKSLKEDLGLIAKKTGTSQFLNNLSSYGVFLILPFIGLLWLIMSIFQAHDVSIGLTSVSSLLFTTGGFISNDPEQSEITALLKEVLSKIPNSLKPLIPHQVNINLPLDIGITKSQAVQALKLAFSSLIKYNSLFDFFKSQDFYHDFKNKAQGLGIADDFDQPAHHFYFMISKEKIIQEEGRKLKEFLTDYLNSLVKDYKSNLSNYKTEQQLLNIITRERKNLSRRGFFFYRHLTREDIEHYFGLLKALVLLRFSDDLTQMEGLLNENKYLGVLSRLEEFLKVNLGQKIINQEQDLEIKKDLQELLGKELNELHWYFIRFASYQAKKEQLTQETKDIQFELKLSKRTASDILRGEASGDCTSLNGSSFYNTIPQFLFDPGILSFRVLEDGKWVGNIYTFAAERDGKPVLIIDAIQLPTWARMWPISVKELTDKILDQLIAYANAQGFREVLMSSFVSNFNAIYQHFSSKYPVEAIEIEKLGGFAHLKALGLWDERSPRNEYLETFSPLWNSSLKKRIDPNNPKQTLLLRRVWQKDEPKQETVIAKEKEIQKQAPKESKNKGFFKRTFGFMITHLKTFAVTFALLFVLAFPNVAQAAKFELRSGPQPNQQQVVAIVEPEDTLWDIAGIAYKDKAGPGEYASYSEWPKIYQVNPQIQGRAGEQLGPQYPDTKQIVIIQNHDELNIPGDVNLEAIGLSSQIQAQTQKIEAQDNQSQEELSKAQKDKKNLEKEIRQLKEKKDNLKKDIHQMKDRIKQLKQILEELQKKNRPVLGYWWDNQTSLAKIGIIGGVIFGLAVFLGMGMFIFRLLRFVRLREMIDKANAKLLALEKDLEALRQEKSNKKELIQLKEELEAIKSKTRATTEEPDERAAKALAVEQKLAESIKALEEKKQKEKQDLDNLGSEKQKLQAEIDALAQEKEKLKTQLTKEKVAFKETIDQLKTQISSAEEERKGTLTEEETILEEELKLKRKEIEVQIEKLHDEFAINQEKLKILKTKIQEKESVLNSFSTQVEELRQKYADLQSAVKGLEAEKFELEKTLQKLELTKEEISKLEKEKTTLSPEVRELEEKKKEAQETIKRTEEMAKSIAPEIKPEQLKDKAKVDPGQLVNILDHLSLTPSGVKREEQIRETLKRYIIPLGARLSQEGESIKNIIIDIPATKGYENQPPIGLNAHIDTTSHNPTMLRVKKDVIEAEGIGGNAGLDDMAGLAVIMEAVRVLCSNNIPHRRIRLILTAEEESGFSGARELVNNRDYSELFKELYLLITIDGHLLMEDDMARIGKDYPLAVKFINFPQDRQNDPRYRAIFDAARAVTDRKDLPKDFSFSAGDEQVFKNMGDLSIAHFRANYSDPRHGRIDSIKTKDLIDLAQWLVNILFNLSKIKQLPAGSSKGQGMFTPEEHSEVNEIISAAQKENRGLLIWGDIKGWQDAKDKHAKDILWAISTLKKYPPLSTPGLGRIDIAEIITASNIILIQPRNNSPPGLVVKDKDAYQIAHSGEVLNSIYIDEVIYKSLYSFEIAVLLAHEAIELGAKKLAKEKRIPWTTELAKEIHQLAEDYEIQIVGKSPIGTGSHFDDRIEEILDFSRPKPETKEEPKEEIIEVKPQEPEPKETLIPQKKKPEEPLLKPRVYPEIQNPDMINRLRNMFLESLLRNTSSNLPAKFEGFPAPIADELRQSYELQKINRIPLDADILATLVVFFSRILPKHTDKLIDYLKNLSIYLVDNNHSTYGATLSSDTFYIQRSCLEDLLSQPISVEGIYQGIKDKEPMILAALFRIIIHEIGSAFFKLSHPTNQALERLFLAILSKTNIDLPPNAIEEISTINNTVDLDKLVRLDWAQKRMSPLDFKIPEHANLLKMLQEIYSLAETLNNTVKLFIIDSFTKNLTLNPRLISMLNSLAKDFGRLTLEIDIDTLIDTSKTMPKLKGYGFREALALFDNIQKNKSLNGKMQIRLVNINPNLDKEKIMKMLQLEGNSFKELITITDIPQDYLIKGVESYLIDGSIRIVFEDNLKYWGKAVDIVVKKGKENEVISSLSLIIAGLAKDPEFYAILPQELKEYIVAVTDDKGNILLDTEARIKQLIFMPIDRTKVDAKYLEQLERDNLEFESRA